MDRYRNKNILVVGLGKSGLAACRYLAKAGALVTATDTKGEKDLPKEAAILRGENVSLALGGHSTELFEKADMIVVSPGVPSTIEGIKKARAKNIPVIGEMELAVREMKSPIIAVTGTNGKTTTTALIGHLFSKSGVKVSVAGNIGTCILDVLEEANRSDFVVLEVSSFQIETTPSLKPDISILLNATPDHLDRHSTFEKYLECKANLIKQTKAQGYGIYNIADEDVARMVVDAWATLVPFDATGRVIKNENGAPRGWFGKSSMWVKTSGEANRYPLENVVLEGVHNRENMLAAILAAELAGLSYHSIKDALSTFKGLPHRVQLIGEFGGVRFYDDSKGTNIGATIRALEAFAEPVVLIAGGLSKGVDFSPLVPVVKKHVKKAVLIGEAASVLKAKFEGSTETTEASSMEDAVRTAIKAAEPGDVVLLSPACSSFDMFRDYAHRGEEFTKAVMRHASCDMQDA